MPSFPERLHSHQRWELGLRRGGLYKRQHGQAAGGEGGAAAGKLKKKNKILTSWWWSLFSSVCFMTYESFYSIFRSSE